MVDIIRKAAGLFTVKKPFYQLRGDSIVCSAGNDAEEKICLADIGEWIDHNDPWICWVTLRLNYGREIVWRNTDCQLEKILYAVAPAKVRVEGADQTAREQRAGCDLNRMSPVRSAFSVVQKGSLHARPRVSHT